MSRLKLLGVFLLITVLPGAAVADLIDFRDAAWSGAHGLRSWTVGDVTVEIYDPYGTHADEVLYWDLIDGFGVTSPEDFTDPDGMREPDEIDDGESFRISFAGSTYVYGVRLTDLYQYSDPVTGGEWVPWPYHAHDGSGELEGEGGSVIPDEDWDARVQFWGQDSDQANGEQYVSLNMFVTTLEFANVCSNSDYSVAGVEVVPVPGAVLLGMIGLSVAGVKLRKRV